MKKTIIMLGTIAAVILMVSSATAVQTINSKSIEDKVEQFEESKNLFKKTIAEDEVNGICGDGPIKKLIDLVVKLIELVIRSIAAGIAYIAGQILRIFLFPVGIGCFCLAVVGLLTWDCELFMNGYHLFLLWLVLPWVLADLIFWGELDDEFFPDQYQNYLNEFKNVLGINSDMQSLSI